MLLTPPEPLCADHRIDGFCSGEPSLDDWLKRRARPNQVSGATRSFVLRDEQMVVIGYYALSSGAIAVNAVPGRFRRNMPDPIPVVLLARLAIERSFQGRGIGRALFRDAARRVFFAASGIGIRGIVVHALSEDAKAFYLALGFEACPRDSMTLVVTLSDLAALLE